ncbi:hypothetical protein BDV11DRAFT_29187 [Aspergillus similis]
MSYNTSNTAGPHTSDMANRVDPRVDSDLSRSQYGAGTGTTGVRGAGNEFAGTQSYGGNTTTGPHSSNLANKVDPRVDSSQYGGASAHGNTSTTGPHNSNLMNKVDPRVDSSQYGGASHGTYGSSTHGASATGPHSSGLANKADPRVDSDQYGSAGNTFGASTHGRDSTSTKTFEDAHFGTGPHTGGSTSTNAGPHNSNLMNKVDPRVDSDTDNRARYTPGATATGNTHSATSGNAGPHSSNLMNKADPRVDSDRDNRAKYAPQTTNTGNEYTAISGNAGPHTSNLANKADPRVDSDRDTRSKYAPGTTTAAPSSNAGPHNSNLMNKADPRVDSDRDHRAQHGTTTGAAGATGATGATGTTGTTGTSAAGTSHGTHTGEKVHSSNLLNKLDPRVDSTTGQMKNSHSSTSSNTNFGGVGNNPATASNSAHHTGQPTATRTGENAGSGVKGAAAEIHGMGESLRGGLGAAVDRAFGDEEGVTKNRAVAQQGDHEMSTGRFH